MKNKKLKRISLINLIGSYIGATLLLLLIFGNRAEVPPLVEEELGVSELFSEKPREEFIYIEKPTSPHVVERSVGIDRGLGVVLNTDRDVGVLEDHGVRVVENRDPIVVERGKHLKGEIFKNEKVVGDSDSRHINGGFVGDVHGGHRRGDVVYPESRSDADGVGLVDVASLNKEIEKARAAEKREEYGVGTEEGLNLTLSKDKVGNFEYPEGEPASPLGSASKKGKLYAYNFPSQGVGAGVGNPALGAGAGSAGLGAGIGEAVLNGTAVPALGGVGTQGSAPTFQGGVGGLVGGAGAGGAAGLTTALVKKPLGIGIGSPVGYGGSGEGGEGRSLHLKHLPPQGSLHIMMHVDGSGSILNTRKELEVMKDTILKEALLPYYNNNESLYERRVTIVDGEGERTLKFFKAAAQKENVLALVFQDEAQPAYHLPNFNRAPAEQYLTDLHSLKSSLGGHTGLYRGIMFQVDRGRTFAKSFKEFVESSWQGKGYLTEANLKKYYWEENKHHIDNKKGIVFSDIYHVKDEGDARYYLDLIFKASRQVGIDLNIYGAGLTDGVSVD